MSLQRLLEQATPGPWEPITDLDDEERAWVLCVAETGRTYVTPMPSHNGDGMLDADARLVALAPDAIRLLTDMADALAQIDHSTEACEGECMISRKDLFEQLDGAALLARFAELDQRAAQ